MDIINEVYENTKKFEKFSIEEKRSLEVRNQLLKLINPQLLFFTHRDPDEIGIKNRKNVSFYITIPFEANYKEVKTASEAIGFDLQTISDKNYTDSCSLQNETVLLVAKSMYVNSDGKVSQSKNLGYKLYEFITMEENEAFLSYCKELANLRHAYIVELIKNGLYEYQKFDDNIILVLFDVVPINVSKYFKMYIVELFKKDGFSVVQFVNTNLILGVSTTKK